MDRCYKSSTLTRREACGLLAALAVPGFGMAASMPIERTVPRSGERLPALGLGTWQVLDVPARGSEYDAARSAVRGFLAAGGRVIDSSPMYGSSEERVGDILADLKPERQPFLATKIWTTGRESGERQLADSHRLMRAKTLDLVQVHNLQDLDSHLATLRAARDAGTVRYIGVTHYLASAHAELERVIRREKPDFVQVNYSIAEPEAGARLLPVARELGVARAGEPPLYEGRHDRSCGRARPAARRVGTRLPERRAIVHQVGARRARRHGHPRGHPEPAPCRRESRGRGRPRAGRGPAQGHRRLVRVALNLG